MMTDGPRGRPRTVIVIGFVFVVIGLAELLLTSAHELAYGTLTGGALVVAVGLMLERAERRRKR